MLYSSEILQIFCLLYVDYINKYISINILKYKYLIKYSHKCYNDYYI